MIDAIIYIHSRLDRLSVLPVAFVAVLALAVLATAIGGEEPPPQRDAAADLTAIAAAVP